MKQNVNICKRLMSVFTIFVLLPLLIFNERADTDGMARGNSSFDRCYSDYGAQIALPANIRIERILSSSSVKYSKYSPSKKYEHPVYIDYLLNRSSGLIALVCIAFLLSITAKAESVFSRKYILKYIHDQDGHKGISSDLYAEKNNSEGKINENSFNNYSWSSWHGRNGRLGCVHFKRP